MKALLTLFSFFFWSFIFGQTQEINISFSALFQDQKLTEEPLNLNPGVQIEMLKFYVSNVTLLSKGKTVFTEQSSFHLIDATDNKASGFELKLPIGLTYDQISFNVGIDSLTNVSGAMGGDLDPTKGMYWTWQSGYINFKLEGISLECPARKNKFQFHLGGYAHPYATVQNIELSIPQGDDIKIQLDLNNFFAEVELAKTYQVMQPSTLAVELSKLLPTLFSVAQ